MQHTRSAAPLRNKGLNEQFKASGKPLIKITPVDEVLEDEDILEMTNAGLIGITVVKSHVAEFWAKVFDNIKVHTTSSARVVRVIPWRAFYRGRPL